MWPREPTPDTSAPRFGHAGVAVWAAAEGRVSDWFVRSAEPAHSCAAMDRSVVLCAERPVSTADCCEMRVGIGRGVHGREDDAWIKHEARQRKHDAEYDERGRAQRAELQRQQTKRMKQTNMRLARSATPAAVDRAIDVRSLSKAEGPPQPRMLITATIRLSESFGCDRRLLSEQSEHKRQNGTSCKRSLSTQNHVQRALR